MVKIILIALCILTLLGCPREVPKELIFFDFETDAELDRIHWKCFTVFKLSEKYATHGKKSLKIELYPSDWPGWTPKIRKKDWRKYKHLCFDIFNPGDSNAEISIRIDDKEDYPEYKDRYNRRFILQPGSNSISIPLESMMTSGTNRKINLKNIHQMLLFMGSPDRKFTFYLDYVRLEG
jgi:hypothetical protein